MIRVEERITEQTSGAIRELYGAEFESAKVPLQRTRKDLEGDFTLVVFPFLKLSRKSPADTAEDIGR